MAPHDRSSPTGMRTDSTAGRASSESQVLKQLGRDTGAPVNASEKIYLTDTGFIRGATEEDDYGECLEALRTFRGAVRADRAAQGARRGGARQTQAAGDAVLLGPVGTPEELERARVLSKHFARIAAEEPETFFFRRGFFGDGRTVVSLKEARAIVESPSLHCLLPGFFREKDIPRLNHRSRLLARVFGVDEQIPQSMETFRLELEWEGGRIEHTEKVLPGDRYGEEAHYLEYPGSKRPGRLPVRRGGCLWQLLRASQHLASRFWWSKADSTWFLLTGTVPSLHPVQVSVSTEMLDAGTAFLKKLSIRALSFTSAATVKRAYLDAIKWRSQGKRGPAINISNLCLFDFVEDWKVAEQREPPWAELMRLWNAAADSDRRYSDRAHFRRDYLRTKDLLTRTEFLPAPPQRKVHKKRMLGSGG